MQNKLIPFEATIKWIKRETKDTATYALKITKSEIRETYRFTPGQFNMLYMPGIGESAISISSAPTDEDLTHTIRTAGDVTRAISRLNPGSPLAIRGPLGNGWPLEEIKDRDLMIIGGGLGIASLRSLIRYMLTTRGTAKSPLGIILYGSKTPEDIIFRDEFPMYENAFRVFLTVDKADKHWKGEVGLVTELIKKVSFDPLNTVAFVCGPEVMMHATIKELIVRGVSTDKIFLSMERNMNCGIGICGHCLFGPKFVCRDGPVFRLTDIEKFLDIKEI